MDDELYQAEGFFVLRTPLLPFEALSLPWRTLLRRPEVMEALTLASPSLVASLPVLDSAPGTERARKVERSLLRYLSRMAARPTPLGLLAGISVGRLGERTELRLPPLPQWVKHRRVDFDALDAAARTRALEQRDTMSFRPAQSLRIVESSVSATVLDPESRRYQTVSVEASSELLEALTGDGGEYRDELIDAQLFEPVLLPTLTGDSISGEAQVDLVKPAPALILGKDVARAALRLLNERLARGFVTTSHSHLSSATSQRHASHAQPSFATPERHASSAPKQPAAPALTLRRSTALDAFRAAFSVRYGDQEVPLLEVLDEELGIGLGHFPPRLGLPSLVADLPLPPFPVKSVDEPPDLPDAFALRAVLSAKGELRLLDGVIGPSGARAFGRFCRASPELDAGVRVHLRHEESLAPDVVFVEVVHLPAPKGADVVTRPVLREYELPYLGRSGAPADKQLSLEDLVVRMRDGWIQLWSKRLAKEVR
ncbi:MAG: lantibiotic dehydratase, partial [Myxococcaceae bacterium]